MPKKVDACLKLESILPNAPLSHTWVLARQRNGSCILACLDTYAHGPFHYLDASRPKRWLYMYSDAILHLIQDAVPGRRPVGLLINNHTTAISFLASYSAYLLFLQCFHCISYLRFCFHVLFMILSLLIDNCAPSISSLTAYSNTSTFCLRREYWLSTSPM